MARTAKAKADNKPLRFAALIRVSTESQAKQGESLRTQAGQIERAVESLGGVLVEKYAGQEHATAGWEREQLNKLLEDAQKPKRPFDAVVVADPSRWSRDNVASEKGLLALRDNGVKFFVLLTEYDLFEPQALLFLGLNSLIGAFQAKTQKQKSMLNRIERIKRGIPAVGNMPFGRTFDHSAGKWIVDGGKQAMVRDVAKRYLAGESLRKMAEEYDINHSHLIEVLRDRSGDKWTVKFRAKDLNIDETVVIPVPRLLPEKTIKAISEQLQANRTYVPNVPTKYNYLLRGKVFCEKCGAMLTGASEAHGRFLYYRHGSYLAEKCPLKPRPRVRANELEEIVVNKLFDLFGNPAALARAVEAAVPDAAKTEKHRQRLQDELTKIEKARNRVLTLIEKDVISDGQAEEKLLALKAREEKARRELDQLMASTVGLPDAATVRQVALHVVEVCGSIIVEDDEGNEYAGGNSVGSFIGMSAADKRKLIEMAFSGVLPDGRRAGVYIRTVEGGSHNARKFSYVLRGQLIDAAKTATSFARSSPGGSLNRGPAKGRFRMSIASHGFEALVPGCRNGCGPTWLPGPRPPRESEPERFRLLCGTPDQ